MISFPKFNLTYKDVATSRDQVSRELDLVRVSLNSAADAIAALGIGISGAATIDVANEAALTSLPSGGYPVGQLAYVRTFKCLWVKSYATATAAPHVRVACNGASGYQWMRMLWSPSWWSNLSWFANKDTGDDENIGTVTGKPVRTLAEQNRRFISRSLPGVETNSFQVTLQTDAAANDYFQVHTDQSPRNGIFTATLQGTVTAIPCGTIASAVARSAATNQSNDITVTGFDFAPYVGMNVRKVGTTNTTACIAKAISLGVARLGEQTAAGTFGTGFIAGDVIEIASLTKCDGFYARSNWLTVSANDVNFQPASGGSGRLVNESEWNSQSILLNRCEVHGSGTIISGAVIGPKATNFVGITTQIRGQFSPDSSEFVDCDVSLFGGPRGGMRHHWQSCGLQNSQLTIYDGGIFRTASDFHCFDLNGTTRIGGVILRPGSGWYGAGRYYGSGNAATSAGVVQLFSTFASVFGPPPITGAVGFAAIYYDAADLALVGGTPVNPWANYALSPRMNIVYS